MSQLSLYLFGPPRVELDGTPIHISRRKATALLVYLAVTGQSHSRDWLATLLWPDNDQSGARGRLRRMLSEIKGILGEGWLEIDRENARLKGDDDLSSKKSFWLDVRAFQEKLAGCETHNYSGSVTCPACVSEMEAAVELYQDDFLAGFSLKDCRVYEEWQFFQVEELRSQLANALVRLCSHYESINDYQSAIDYARRWLALDRLHEAAHRQLMILYDQTGQRSAALRQYQICREMVADELGVAPSPSTSELYEQIQSRSLVTPRDLRLRNNLPVQATPFIGRESELAEIKTILEQDDCRLLTLLGPGGSGKTRLGIEAARAQVENFPDGVFFVNLAPVQEADKIPVTVASALGFSFYEDRLPFEQLLDYLRNKELLLLFDNFEHLLVGTTFVTKIILTAPKVKVLVTSRVSMALFDEHIYPVMGMAFPDAPSLVETMSEKYSAVKLFESGAKRIQPDFELTEDNIVDVVSICRLVEGMPLGVILAANWVRMLSPGEIAIELAQDLAFLETDLRDMPSRQRSILTVFNYSWRLLNAVEQNIIKSLSVFRGGFTRQAAQKLTGASLRDLKRLIDQSMLHITPTGRYEIHELLRQFAAQKLGMDPEEKFGIHDKHSQIYCHSLAEWELALQGPQQVIARKEMVREIDNIRAAWSWAVEKVRLNRLLEGINGLCIFFDRNRQRVEGEETCRFLVDRLEVVLKSVKFPPVIQDKIYPARSIGLKLQARALDWGGFFSMRLGNVDRAFELLQKSLSIIESRELAEHDTRFERGVAYAVLPAVIDQSLREETERLAEEAVQLFRSLDDERWAFYVSLFLTTYLSIITEERWYFDEIRTITRKQGDLIGIADRLEGESWGYASNFQFETAEEMLSEALDISMELDDRMKIVSISATMGWQWIWHGRFEDARSLYHETLATYSDLDYSQSSAFNIQAHLGYSDLYLGDYNEARKHALHTMDLLGETKHFLAGLWKAYCLDIVGKVALVEGRSAEADKYFQDCLLVFKTYDHREKISGTLTCLGYIARNNGQINESQDYFYHGLDMAINVTAIMGLAHALPGIALLFADQGDYKRAVEIYALASTMGMVDNSKWFTDIAGDELVKVIATLPAEFVEEAKNRVQAPVSWETAAELLAELEELGWNDVVSESTE